jgi:heptaprenyl diphosphate synthase
VDDDPYTLLTLPGIKSALERVEEELRIAVKAEEPLLTKLSRHLIDAGGKRIRPSLAIASSQILEDKPVTPSREVILGGVAVELVHQGSLYHDDVMDGAKTRRNVKSVNEEWGNHEAILGGDYLLARASEIAAGLGAEVAGLLASTIAALCEGQIREVNSAYDITRTEDAYMSSISGKTGALLSASAKVGAIVSGYPEEVVTAVTKFGNLYGVAFQIVDDLLDVMASEKELGKPSGNDMLEGVYTLPVIRALKGPNGEALKDLLRNPISRDRRDEALMLVRSDEAITSTIETALDFTHKAQQSLKDLPNNPTAEILKSTCTILADQVNYFNK